MFSELNINCPLIHKYYNLLGKNYHFVQAGLLTQIKASKNLCLFYPIKTYSLKVATDIYVMRQYKYKLAIMIILTDNSLFKKRYIETRLLEFKRVFYMNRPANFYSTLKWKIAMFNEIDKFFQASHNFSIYYFNSATNELDCILEKTSCDTYSLPALTDETYKHVCFDLAVITKKLFDKGYCQQ